MTLDIFLQWASQNSSWFIPALYLVMMVLIAGIVYVCTHFLILSFVIEGTLSLAFIFLVYIPFRSELKLEFATLFGFILMAIMCFSSPLWYSPRIK